MRNSNVKENCITVQTFGESTITKKQAKYLAISIFPDIKKYIEDHRVEFEQWQAEQAGKNDEVA